MCNWPLVQTFQNEFTHSWFKKMSGQKRLNKEMSSTDTALGASEYFGGEPGLSCWTTPKLRRGVWQPLLRTGVSGMLAHNCKGDCVSLLLLDSHEADPAQMKERKSFVRPQSPRQNVAQCCQSGMGKAGGSGPVCAAAKEAGWSGE